MFDKYDYAQLKTLAISYSKKE